jgi:hypothetical protein
MSLINIIIINSQEMMLKMEGFERSVQRRVIKDSAQQPVSIPSTVKQKRRVFN